MLYIRTFILNIVVFYLQFQMRGTEHVHGLLSIKHDGISSGDIVDEVDADSQQKVKKLVASVITARLEPSESNSQVQADYENSYNFCPGADFYSDENDPRRKPFNFVCDPPRDYSRDEATGLLNHIKIQSQYRALQIANQVHRCTNTCWKNCSKYQARECRFYYPVPQEYCSELDVVIRVDKDKKNRKRIRAMAPRNNGNLNPNFVSALLTCAWGGNVDCQYIYSDSGAAEYAASYASKAEDPDAEVLLKLFIRGMDRFENPTDLDAIKVSMESVMRSQQVGTVQACKFLLGLKFVKSNRVVNNINPLPRDKINKTLVADPDVLATMDTNGDVVQKGVNSQLGRRGTYMKLVKHQREHFGGECNVTFFSFETSFSVSAPGKKKQVESTTAFQICEKTGENKLFGLNVGDNNTLYLQV
jgi:hypothetical protein